MLGTAVFFFPEIDIALMFMILTMSLAVENYRNPVFFVVIPSGKKQYGSVEIPEIATPLPIHYAKNSDFGCFQKAEIHVLSSQQVICFLL